MAAWSKPRFDPDWFRRDLCPKGYVHAGLLKALRALEEAGPTAGTRSALLEAVVNQAEKAAEDILGAEGEQADLRARSRVLYALADLALKAAKTAGRDAAAERKEVAACQGRLEKLGAAIKQALKSLASSEERERALKLVATFQKETAVFTEKLAALDPEEARPFAGFARSATATAEAFGQLRQRLQG
jgi:hypothetical protein